MYCQVCKTTCYYTNLVKNYSKLIKKKKKDAPVFPIFTVYNVKFCMVSNIAVLFSQFHIAKSFLETQRKILGTIRRITQIQDIERPFCVIYIFQLMLM